MNTRSVEEEAAALQKGQSLLDQLINMTRPDDQTEHARARKELSQFLDLVVKPGQVVSKNVATNIKAWINEIDKKLSVQLNEIMHHPDLQKLESTWRGLHYLVHQSETGASLKIRVLNASKRELAKDLEKAVIFDQSALFKKVYEEQYGPVDGQPYGLLIGDYEFGQSAEDVGLLQKLAGVASSAHVPFVAGAAPKMFGMDDFTELARPRALTKVFDAVDYVHWRSFRESADARNVALVMPRVLARLPYGEKSKPIDEFKYEEAWPAPGTSITCG